jgi:hypothetical protein
MASKRGSDLSTNILAAFARRATDSDQSLSVSIKTATASYLAIAS